MSPQETTAMPTATPPRIRIQPLPSPAKSADGRGRPAKIRERKRLDLPPLPRRPPAAPTKKPHARQPAPPRPPEQGHRPVPSRPPAVDFSRRSAVPVTRHDVALGYANTIAEHAPIDPSNLRGVLKDRYRITRRIDVGGQGVVYEAYDEIERRAVALKVWSGLNGEDTFRLKREFRAASHIPHRNLARLYNLVEQPEAGLAFFTMELVRGVDFVTHVYKQVPSGHCRADLGRLRRAIRQVAEGVAALHENRLVHRDLKPSNIMVCDDDRVVVLDFGLAASLRNDMVTLRTSGIEGTPHFMAPEQLGRDAPVSPPSDCYALGVMLYEALTGTMPLESDTLAELLAAKHYAQPNPPSSRVSGIPAELDALVLRLLARDPEARATIRDILTWCNTNTETSISSTTPPQGSHRSGKRPKLQSAVLLGRTKPLRQLRRALGKTLARQTQFALVAGPSGAGKSALLRHFIDDLRDRYPTAVILTGRCLERESVPYRAFDSLIEELARFLASCDEGERERLLDGCVAQLPRIFPVLSRVPGLEVELAVDEAPLSGQRLRAQAFVELRDLLRRIGELRPLILFIDDLHLGDLDSASLLDTLLEAPDAPPMLLLASARSGAAERSPFIQQLKATPEQIELDPLSPREATTFARTCLGDLVRSRSRLAAELARACNGNAAQIERFAEVLRSHPNALAHLQGDDAPLSLARLLAPLVAELSPLARRLLDLLAVENAPIALGLLDVASGRPKQLRDALAELRELSLACIEENDESPEAALVECPQLNIRQAVAQCLSKPAVEELHRALARAHQASALGDDERCAHHLLAASDTPAAMHHAANAAFIAQSALAFDHAIALYLFALECDPNSRELRLKLADVLASAGRFEEAAMQQLRTAFAVQGRRRVEIAAAACEHFFLAGRADRGRRTAHGILEQLGIEWPELASRTQHLLRNELANLAAHTLEFREQSRCQIGGDLLLKIDVCITLGRLLLASDPERAGFLAARGCQLALMAGEARQVAQGLALTGALASAENPALAERLLDRADTIANEIRDSYAIGLASLCRGLFNLREGHLFEALASFSLGTSTLRTHGVEGRWEQTTAFVGTLTANAALGELDSLRQAIATAHSDSDLAEDPAVRPWITLYSGTLLLAEGHAGPARTRMCEAIRQLAEVNRHLAHAYGTKLAILCDLHGGMPDKAQSRLWRGKGAESEAATRVDSIHIHRGFWALLEGKVALACALSRPRPSADHIAVLERASALLSCAPSPALLAEVALMQAGLAHLRSTPELTIRSLNQASDELLNAGMTTAQTCVQLRLAEYLAAERDSEQRARLHKRLKAQVSDPERWARTVLPEMHRELRDEGAVAA